MSSNTWSDIQTHNIFIVVGESELDQQSSVVRLILTQLIDYLERRQNRYTLSHENQIPVLILFDEFARFGKLECIESAIATLRKKNVTIAIFVQSLAQIDKHYGVAGRRIILDNCRFQAILGASDVESQMYFSNLVGCIKTTSRSSSKTYNSQYSEVLGQGVQVSESLEPIFYPHEFAHLEDYMILVTPQGFSKIRKIPYYKGKLEFKLIEGKKCYVKA